MVGFIQVAEAVYSFRVTVKYPFISDHYEYDSLGGVTVISDSLARSKLLTAIIFYTEKESLYQKSATNDSGFATITFDTWQSGIPVSIDNIVRMAIDFPNTDRVIRVGDKITFEHLKYSDIDFRRSPEEIEIVLPMTVTKDEFIIGDTNWLNVCNFAVMNDMHIGEGFTDFGSNGWDDDSIAGQTNSYIQNNENIVAAINNLSPDFVAVLGDVTNSVEWSELQKAKCVLGGLEVLYIPILGNHDTRPYTDDDGESGIPDETYFAKYFYDAFAGIYDTNSLQFANWSKGPYFSTISPPDSNTYYLN
ncbi:MAG: metallophosphoesterase family protein [bacterium]